LVRFHYRGLVLGEQNWLERLRSEGCIGRKSGLAHRFGWGRFLEDVISMLVTAGARGLGARGLGDGVKYGSTH
jgi:hypothetical protein